MPAALASSVGVPAQQEHPNKARDKRNRAHPPNTLNISPSGEPLKHGRHPKPKSVAAGIAEEQPDSEQYYRRLAERLPNRNVLYVRFGLSLLGKASSHPIAFVGA